MIVNIGDIDVICCSICLFMFVFRIMAQSISQSGGFVWTPDDAATFCALCSAVFGVFNRKVHITNTHITNINNNII